MSPAVEETANLVSGFVEQRIAVPRDDEVELWTIGVYAALFSAAFEMQMAFASESGSVDQFNLDLADLIERVTEIAAKWIEDKIKKGSDLLHPKIRIDVRDALRHHLKVCFHEALSVMEDRDYDIRTARTHSCVCFCSEGVRSFVGRLLISPKDGQQVLIGMMESCDAIGDEIRGIIYRTRP